MKNIKARTINMLLGLPAIITILAVIYLKQHKDYQVTGISPLLFLSLPAYLLIASSVLLFSTKRMICVATLVVGAVSLYILITHPYILRY